MANIYRIPVGTRVAIADFPVDGRTAYGVTTRAPVRAAMMNGRQRVRLDDGMVLSFREDEIKVAE